LPQAIAHRRSRKHARTIRQVSLEQLKGQIEAANAEFPCINFKTRLREDAASGVAVVAEIKVRERAAGRAGAMRPGENEPCSRAACPAE